MEFSKWVASLMDVDRAPLEFTGDDVNRFTSVIDLGWPFEFVTVILPIMDSADVTLYVQRTAEVDEVPSLLHVLDYDAAGSLIQTSATVSTAAIALTFRIGGAQFFRLYTSADQSGDITFWARGFNRSSMF